MTDPNRNKTDPDSTEEPIFNRVVPDGLRDKLKQLVGEFKLPRELVNYMMTQVDETKHAAVAIVAREVREFLEKTNLSEEVVKVLTRVSFEVTTNIKFLDNETGEKRGVKIAITRPESKAETAASAHTEASEAPAEAAPSEEPRPHRARRSSRTDEKQP